MNLLAKRRWAAFWRARYRRAESLALLPVYEHLIGAVESPDDRGLTGPDQAILAEHLAKAWMAVAATTPPLVDNRRDATRKWWAELRADPARYAEFVERRKALAAARRAPAP